MGRIRLISRVGQMNLEERQNKNTGPRVCPATTTRSQFQELLGVKVYANSSPPKKPNKEDSDCDECPNGNKTS